MADERKKDGRLDQPLPQRGLQDLDSLEVPLDVVAPRSRESADEQPAAAGRLTVELVLPGGARLLLRGKQRAASAGKLSIAVDNPPGNDPQVLDALEQLAAEADGAGDAEEISLPPIDMEELSRRRSAPELDGMALAEQSTEDLRPPPLPDEGGGAGAADWAWRRDDLVEVGGLDQLPTESTPVARPAIRPGKVVRGGAAALSRRSSAELIEEAPPSSEAIKELKDETVTATGFDGGEVEARPASQAEGEKRPARKRPPSSQSRRVRRDAPVVGIDFGTSYSAVAVMDAGIRMIPDDSGETLTPSVVSFPAPGEVVVGSEARRRMAGEAQWTIASPKRLLGRAYRDPQVSSLLGPMALRTFAGTDKLIRFDAHGQIYSVTDICALILGKLRERACRYLGATVIKAVFSVPVGFGSLHRSALQMAARQAGLQGVAMMTEPASALLAHGYRGGGGLAAVYDFGGGTFDFCVVEIADDAFNVICSGGDPWLGGDDFDNAMAGQLADRFWKDAGVDLRTRAVEWQRLLFACEAAKRKLSSRPSTEVRVDDLIHTHQGSKGLAYRFSVREFIPLIKPLVDRSLEIVDRVMGQAKIEPRRVDALVMTGGTSLIPYVRERVSQRFRRKPVVGDAETAVVRGTALRAAELAGEPMAQPALGGRTLREVSGRTIGVGLKKGPVFTLFERDTPLPAEARRTFQTQTDGQTEMLLTLYEGTKSRIDQRQVLGQLRYKGLRAAPAGEASADFTFQLDEDGLLHVTAKVEGNIFSKTIRLG